MHLMVALKRQYNTVKISSHTEKPQKTLIADGSSNKPFLELYEQGIQQCHITPPADSITQATKRKNQFLALVAGYKAF